MTELLKAPQGARELQALNDQLHQARNRFNMLEDTMLLEACIYEIKALEARVAHLMRRCKEEQGVC